MSSAFTVGISIWRERLLVNHLAVYYAYATNVDTTEHTTVV